MWPKYEILLLPSIIKTFITNISLDKCFPRGSEVCKNGGTCVIDFDGDTKCNCSDGFQGAHCEVGMIKSH